jgi:Fis family transcriptional regulator, factor for inversion stimulation protein
MKKIVDERSSLSGRSASWVERRNQPLSQCIKSSLDAYFSKLNGHNPGNLYDLVIAEMERPLLEVVMRRADGNLTKAALVLGMNRSTLRKKLKKYGLD